MTEYPTGSTAEENLNKTIENINTDTTNLGETNYTTYTISKNGTYTFEATLGDKTTETKIRVKKIEKFTKVEDLKLSYANSEQKAYKYYGASIPKGYYVDTRTKVDTGLVITDDIDEEGYSIGNEWVWVPVNSEVGNDDFYYEGTGIMAGTTSVNFAKYSKLYEFSTNLTTGVTTKTVRIEVNPSEELGYREPSLLTDSTYGESAYYGSINSRTTKEACKNINEVATQYVTDYNNMIKSVDTHKGFYIGRYEITENGEQPGAPITNQNWYYLYNQCMVFDGDYVESSMIYGTLWDSTMQWLAKLSYAVGKTENAESGYGNYKSEDVVVKEGNTTIILKSKGTSKVLQTGETSYTRRNNIYDLSGNCSDWTQEANGTNYRVYRGGNYNFSSSNLTYTAFRYYNDPSDSYASTSARPLLYIK